MESAEAARIRPSRWLDGVGLDIKLGLRMLYKSWGLTLIGGFAMAIAISMGATAFAVLDAYEGGALPLADGDRLVRLMTLGQKGPFTSVEDFEWWRREMRSVEDVSAFTTTERLVVTGKGNDGPASIAQMTASGFRAAGASPFLGRTLTEEDERGATPAAVIGYALWQARFGGEREAVGQVVQIGGVDHVVVGVMPEGFAFPINHQLWTPLPTGRFRAAGADVVVFGRLRAGAMLATADAEIAAKGPAPSGSESGVETRAHVAGYASSLGGAPMWLSAVPWALALLLVPPCANIAILIYARNVSRQEEFAARYVLGAGRGRIVGQLMIEALVLSGVAAGAGVVLAQRLLMEFHRVAEETPGVPFWIRPEISMGTVLFVLGLTAFAGAIAGGLPALRATGRMRQSAFQALGGRTSPRLGVTWAALVVAQVALSTAVLPRFGEGLWMFFSPSVAGREFAADQYVTTRIALEDERGVASLRTLARQVQERLGVMGATVSTSIDGIDEAIGWMEVDGDGGKPFLVGANQVDEAYFDAFEAPLLAGRGFEAADFTRRDPVVVVDRMFSEQLGGQNPLGRRVRFVVEEDEGDAESAPWHEIVGVVDRISPSAQRPFVYHPIELGGSDRVSLTLRTGSTLPADFTRRLAETVVAIDPKFQLEQLRSLEELYRNERQEENGFGLAFATVSWIIVLFSAAGIHTLVAFALALRRREIGIRSALGAAPLRLLTDVLRRDLSPVVGGAVLGALLSFPADKLILRNDGGSITMPFVLGALVFMLIVGVVAVAGPAWRALRIDSVRALREA